MKPVEESSLAVGGPLNEVSTSGPASRDTPSRGCGAA